METIITAEYGEIRLVDSCEVIFPRDEVIDYTIKGFDIWRLGNTGEIVARDIRG